jgi:hypothetical protein
MHASTVGTAIRATGIVVVALGGRAALWGVVTAACAIANLPGAALLLAGLEGAGSGDAAIYRARSAIFAGIRRAALTALAGLRTALLTAFAGLGRAHARARAARVDRARVAIFALRIATTLGTARRLAAQLPRFAKVILAEALIAAVSGASRTVVALCWGRALKLCLAALAQRAGLLFCAAGSVRSARTKASDAVIGGACYPIVAIGVGTALAAAAVATSLCRTALREVSTMGVYAAHVHCTGILVIAVLGPGAFALGRVRSGIGS